MSWPSPSPSTSSVPFWAGDRPELPWRNALRPQASIAWAQPQVRQTQRRSASKRKVKYGLGMLAGLVAVHWTKKLVSWIPVVGAVAGPILDLLPTAIVGPALGAAVVYGLEKGDLYAAVPVVRQKAQIVQRELATVADDLRQDWEAVQARQGRAAEQLARTTQQAVDDMERTIVPTVERGFRSIEGSARRALDDDKRGR